MSVAVLIPARFSSSRFEGKVIHPIKDKPMIQWVYEDAKESKLADYIAVLTDDKRVYDVVKSFGGNVFIVKGDFASGSDRVASFCKDKDFDYVLNLQADEPLIDGETLDLLIKCATETKEQMATLVSYCAPQEVDDPNVVKVVIDKNGYAMYFSRSRIPFNRNPFDKYLKHIGVYIYSRKTLLFLNSLEPTELEKAEGLEQLRALQNGIRIKTCFTNKFLLGVDTHEDLERLISYLGERDD